MYSVYQHWDPLKVCAVGRSYPPEYYSWITVPHVRSLFEKIAIETEEDYQNIIAKLESFGVEILRPNLLSQSDILQGGKYVQPPMTPRDKMVMIGDQLYYHNEFSFLEFYTNVKDPSWPECTSLQAFFNLPSHIQDECTNLHKLDYFMISPWDDLFDRVRKQGNSLRLAPEPWINGAMVSRIGRDLYFATENYDVNFKDLQHKINREFPHTRNHIVNTGGHGDGTYCPVCPGLIISLRDVSTYADTFPDWEVVYLPNQSWNVIPSFLSLKERNQGRWWIPGFEHDQSVIDVVEQWMTHWVGYVEETVFDVNILIIDPKNVMVFNYNEQVFKALDRYGITPHVVPFRHRYFWDGGIHCITLDLHREGTMQDFFPQRK